MAIIHTNDLKTLVLLKNKDMEIGGFKKELEAIPEKISELENSFEEKTDFYKEAKKRLIDLQVERKNIEISIKETEGVLEKRQSEQNAVKNNEAYKAMLAEVNNLKKKIDIFETRELELLESADEAEKNLAAAKKDMEALELKKNEEISVFRKKEKKLAEKLESENFARDEIALKIDKDLLSKYESIRKKRNSALVEVREDNNKFYCSGCNMALTSKSIGEVRKKNTLAICENCQRLLYIKENAEKE